MYLLTIYCLAASSQSTQPTPTPTPSPSPGGSSSNPPSQQTNLNTGGINQPSQTGTNTGKATGTNTKAGNGTIHTQYDPTDPAGAVVMTNPPVTAGSQLYKIDDFVTWGWNYTNLLGSPTAVDVLVSCSTASATWTLTQNMTFETQATYTWDTKKFQADNIKNQLPVAVYTLLIYDADSSFTQAADPGYLSPFSGFTFGLYTPQPYTPLGDWTCSTCSGAMSEMERRGLGAAVAMCVVTVFSFTWFVTGFAGMI